MKGFKPAGGAGCRTSTKGSPYCHRRTPLGSANKREEVSAPAASSSLRLGEQTLELQSHGVLKGRGRKAELLLISA